MTLYLSLTPNNDDDMIAALREENQQLRTERDELLSYFEMIREHANYVNEHDTSGDQFLLWILELLGDEPITDISFIFEDDEAGAELP